MNLTCLQVAIKLKLINIKPQSCQQSQAAIQRSQQNFQDNLPTFRTDNRVNCSSSVVNQQPFGGQIQLAVQNPTQQRHPVNYQQANVAYQNQTAAQSPSSSCNMQLHQTGYSTFNINQADQCFFLKTLKSSHQNRPSVQNPVNQHAYVHQQMNVTNTVNSTVHGNQTNRVYHQQPPNSYVYSQTAVRKPTNRLDDVLFNTSNSTLYYSKNNNKAYDPVLNNQGKTHYQIIGSQYHYPSAFNSYNSYGYHSTGRNVHEDCYFQQTYRPPSQNSLQNGLFVLFFHITCIFFM